MNGFTFTELVRQALARASETGNITAKVDELRALLGDPSNGGTAGEQPAWDVVVADNFIYGEPKGIR